MNPHPELVPDMLTFEMARSYEAFSESAGAIIGLHLSASQPGRWERIDPTYSIIRQIDLAHVVHAATWRHEPSDVAVTFSGDENVSHAMTVEDRRSSPGIGWTVGIAAVPSVTDIDPAAGYAAAACAIASAWHAFQASGYDESESSASRWGAGIAAMMQAETGIAIGGIGFPSPYDDVPLIRAVDRNHEPVDHPLLDRLAAVVPNALHVTAKDRLITFGRSFDPREPTWPDDPVAVLRTVAEIQQRLAARESGA